MTMKICYKQLLNNMLYLLGSLLTTTIELLKEEPLINEEFKAKFSNKKDRKKLDKAIEKLKRKGRAKIVLENGEEIIIVKR